MPKSNYPFNVPTDLIPLVPGYLRRREEEIELLLEKLDARDFDRIHLIAHKLTGNGAGYGMPVISIIGRELSECAKSGDAVRAHLCIERLREAIEDIKARWNEQRAA